VAACSLNASASCSLGGADACMSSAREGVMREGIAHSRPCARHTMLVPADGCACCQAHGAVVLNLPRLWARRPRWHGSPAARVVSTAAAVTFTT
jgi:hypothetical protein